MVLAPVAAIATTRVATVAAITPITAITAQAEAAAQPEAGISPRVGCSLLHAAATTAAGHSIVGGRHRAEAELLLWWEVATVAEAIAGLDDLLLLTLHLRRQVVAAFDSGAHFAGLFADLMDRREGGGQPWEGKLTPLLAIFCMSICSMVSISLAACWRVFSSIIITCPPEVGEGWNEEEGCTECCTGEGCKEEGCRDEGCTVCCMEEGCTLEGCTECCTEEGCTEEGCTEEGCTEEGCTEEGCTEEGCTEEGFTTPLLLVLPLSPPTTSLLLLVPPPTPLLLLLLPLPPPITPLLLLLPLSPPKTPLVLLLLPPPPTTSLVLLPMPPLTMLLGSKGTLCPEGTL